MPYEPLPKDSLGLPERKITTPLRDRLDNQKLLDSLDRFPAYGLLLIADPAHPMAKLVRGRWDQLNNMTGERFLLLAFQAPESYSKDFEDSWRKELGGEFAQVWDKWNKEKASSNDAYDYRRMFDGQVIRREDMPCLAVFTHPQAKSAAVLQIPDWTEDELWTFLEGVCDTIDSCADEPDPNKRLQALKRGLTSFPAQARQKVGHLADRATAYITAHPVKVVTTSLSVAVALATGHLIPVGAAGIGFMKDLLGIFKSA
jgi:hypothetical protein